MEAIKKIESALISVFYKDNLEPIIRQLHENGVKLYSTGGTQKFIEAMGIPVTAVEKLTQYPSILGGRVKTLHPKVFGGILYRRDNESDLEEVRRFQIPHIDLVVVDLYPFEETVAAGGSPQEIIEKIDIGGVTLIRAAAKNFDDVLIISCKDQYQRLGEILASQQGGSTLGQRRQFAVEAFATTSRYDSAIFNHFNADAGITEFRSAVSGGMSLRYGENPHQKGTFFGDFGQLFDKLQGKEISYNNLLDIEAAVYLIDEFNDTTFAILKHNNACGIASRPSLVEAWKAALAADPVSAFGGILITNKEVDKPTATEIDNLFFEVIIAPGYTAEALEVLMKKKNRIILVSKNTLLPQVQYRTLLNGVLLQDRDTKIETRDNMRTVTTKTPTDAELIDLVFANKVVKHTKSNTIVLVKNGQLCASGVGQTSRVDALRQAIEKAQSFGFDLKGAVMASDAFFPFPDCVEIAHQAGITAVVQPGGSVKDQDSTDYCNAHGLAMVFTGTRHFKH